MISNSTSSGARPSQLARRSVLLGAALGLLPLQATHAQTGSPVPQDTVDERLRELDSLIATIMRQTGIPGLSVAVVYQDRPVYLRGYGVKLAGRPEPVDPETVFQLASLSKPLAATVMAALVGDGLVTWDDPVIRHDPAFAMHDPWVTRQVTLRDMFSHRSGLPGHAGDALEDIGYDQREVLHRLRHVRPDSSFRSRYAYTNFGLTAAAVAAAKPSGRSWEDLCAERLYRPLGMTDTSSLFAKFLHAPNRAAGHVEHGGAWIAKYTRDASAQSPAGGVSSSARDMAKWLRLQLGRGTLDGQEIVRATALDETHRPQIVSRPAGSPRLDRPSFYGLGWNLGEDEQGRLLWSHSGAFNLGAATSVHLLPAERLGVVVLTNTSPVGVPEAICRSSLDLLLTGKVERDWLGLFGPLFAEAMAPEYGTTVDYLEPPAAPSPGLPAATYIGNYRNDLFGDLRISGADARLTLTLGPKEDVFPLRHFDRDVFTYQPVGENAYGPSAVTFTAGAGRQAVSVTIENLDLNGQGLFHRF
jgi:CubicO group peptidase (beta-lactamase class C family)